MAVCGQPSIDEADAAMPILSCVDVCAEELTLRMPGTLLAYTGTQIRHLPPKEQAIKLFLAVSWHLTSVAQTHGALKPDSEPN